LTDPGTSRAGRKSKSRLNSKGLIAWRRFRGDGFSLADLTAKKSVSVAAEHPSVSGVAGRYATALFELARDESPSTPSADLIGSVPAR
jgi:hypothetical protein